MTKQTKSTQHADTWPVVWRVVAPGAGSYDRDMVFAEVEHEDMARRELAAARRAGWPVRLERIACGPLPPNAERRLIELRSTNAQNAGAEMRKIGGMWSSRP